jgi:GST-like protein
MFESGAILLYLAEKIGRFIPGDIRGRSEVLQWLFWQMSGLGPMAGQAGHFKIYAPEPVPYALERYTRETRRLYGVLDRRLAEREFVAGEFSIVDIACYPWIVPHRSHGQNLDEFPNLKRWFGALAARPATIKAYSGIEDAYQTSASHKLTAEERKILFGQSGSSKS